MGSTVCDAVAGADDMTLVAAVDPGHVGEKIHDVEVTAGVESLVHSKAEAVVDFTPAAVSFESLRWCAGKDIHCVVGTTGFSDEQIGHLRSDFKASKANCVLAPNFAIGAVLMMHYAAQAARWFDTAEIIELHHDRKIDAPSGTAMLTASRMAAASSHWASDPTRSEIAAGARGGDVEGIRVHSVRMRGMVAHQEVVLGTDGQTLTIRHDSMDRVSFMPGVLLALREVAKRSGLTVGLEPLLGL